MTKDIPYNHIKIQMSLSIAIRSNHQQQFRSTMVMTDLEWAYQTISHIINLRPLFLITLAF